MPSSIPYRPSGIQHPKPLLLLSLADNALLFGHRNSEWTGHGPILEQDIALSNIALDLVGQARMLYQYAAEEIGNGETEDTLAYLRDVPGFRNCLMAELPNGHWGHTILKQFFFSAWQYPLYAALQNGPDDRLAAIAAKSLKEVTYHLKWSSEWVIRLGDGTEESHARMQESLEILWPYSAEFCTPASYERAMAEEGTIPDPASLQPAFTQRVEQVLEEAGLECPAPLTWKQQGGKDGVHTEHLGFLLAEMQFLQRAYPGNEW